MSENDSLEGVQLNKLEEQQQQQQPNQQQQQQNLKMDQQPMAAADLACQQAAQIGLNLFWLIQQAASVQMQPQQIDEGTSSSSSTSSSADQQNLALFSAFSNALGVGKASPICAPLMPPAQQQTNGADLNKEKRRRDLAIIGRRWEYVSDVQSFSEFEQLRCRHQVSRNRTFAHGIRYSCTQKTQLRSNCPYLLLCLFSDGAGEHSAPGVGTISVYSRNKHTHPVKVIKARQPRRFAKLAKKGRKGNGGGNEGEQDEGGGGGERHSGRKKSGGKGKQKSGERMTSGKVVAEIGARDNNGQEEEEEEKSQYAANKEAENGGQTGEALIAMLSKMIAEQQRDGEEATNEQTL